MRVLVSVASRHGATAELGSVVAEVLREAGLEVDEVEPDDVEHLIGYDAVVLGSAVYAGRLAAALRALAQRLGAQMRWLPVHLFWSGPVGDPLVPATVPDDVGAVARLVGAQRPQGFPGRLAHDGLSLAERALVALTHAQEGDYRDLDAVRQWATGVAAELTGEADGDEAGLRVEP